MRSPLDVTTFGGAAVAFRQQPGRTLFVDAHAGVREHDPRGLQSRRGRSSGAPGSRTSCRPERRPAPLGAPSVGATSNGVLLVGLGAGQASLAATGNDATIDPATRLDDGRTGVDGGAVVELADSEGAVLAWRARSAAVAVKEHNRDGERHAQVRIRAGRRSGRRPVDGGVRARGRPGRVSTGRGTSPRSPPSRSMRRRSTLPCNTPVRWVRSKRVRITGTPRQTRSARSGTR